jgi:hypothetical protein
MLAELAEIEGCHVYDVDVVRAGLFDKCATLVCRQFVD